MKAGLQQLSEGTALLADSSNLLANGQKGIGSGLAGYQNGLLTLSGNMTQFSQAAKKSFWQRLVDLFKK